MFKKVDYIIITIICFFLGIFLVSQYFSGKEFNKVIQPENNSVIALEVAKMTKTNTDLRREVQSLTDDLNIYQNSSRSSLDAYQKYEQDISRLRVINGEETKTGQGIVITISGNLNTPQIVDLINALKNIGSEIISINGTRLVINTELGQFAGKENYEIKVLGNSEILKSALERKGGIIDQIKNKEIVISLAKSENIVIKNGEPIQFKYAKVVK
jgi:uncharacterized protein YlxW (UPF0749 family)